MKIKSLKLINFRAVGEKGLILPLNDKLTVILGVNGAGKSTILDAIAIVLSRVISRIRYQKSSGLQIKDTDIHIGATEKVLIELEAASGDAWNITKFKSPTKTIVLYDKKYIDDIVKQISESNQNCSIPLFVYYRTNRAVLDIPLRIRRKHDFSLLEAYDDALVGGANFRHFFEWFRNREDLENENRKYIADEANRPNNWSFPDEQLEAVRNALTMAMGDFSDLSVRRNPLRMTVKKQAKEVRVDQLSDGEKCMLAMIGDLARRLAIANPTLQEPLRGAGVVLIDEIELHLHPTWQRTITGKLHEIFPNCQFILSTHSPQIIGEVKSENIRVLTKDANGGVEVSTPTQSLGLDSAEILEREEIMGGVSRRNEDISSKLEDIDRLIDEDNFTDAKIEIERLKLELNGSIPAIVRLEGLITMLDDTE